jgi:hypothetical protein
MKMEGGSGAPVQPGGDARLSTNRPNHPHSPSTYVISSQPLPARTMEGSDR